MKLFKRISILLLVISLITACGVDSAADNDENNDNNRGAKVQNVDDNNDNNDKSRMQIADKAQDKIENLKEVRHANIIVTNRNAYVAVVLEDNSKGEVREELENKISKQVKSTDNNIRNVFVSSNPDFVDRMGDYGDKIQSGKPVRGLVEEFTEMVQRVFPSAK